MKLLLSLTTLLLLSVGCGNVHEQPKTEIKEQSNIFKSDEGRYTELHDKYRTLWYRTDGRCFYDSCRKYGLLLDSCLGISESNVLTPDTITINEPAICK